MKKLTIYVTIAAFVSFMSGGAFCSEPDIIERRMENGSRVMSPGWINIDKQRSESMKESVKSKTTPEEQMQKINADLQTSLGERTTDTVKPDLKKKKGAGESDTKTVIISEVITVNAPDSALVEKALEEIAGTHNVTKGKVNYEALSGGNVVFWWLSDDPSDYNLYGQTYNKDGVASDTRVLISSSETGWLGNYEIKALSNDRFVVGYYDSDYYSSFKIFGSDSGCVNGFSTDFNLYFGTEVSELNSITALSDGSFAVGWNGQKFNYTTRRYNPTSYVKIFGSDGNIKASIDPSTLNTPNITGLSQITTLSNGNIAAFWWAKQGNDYNLYFSLFNTEGALIKEQSTDTGGADIKVAALSNGNFVVGWHDYHTSYIQVYNSEDAAFGDKQIVAQSPDIYSRNRLDTVTVLSNGNFVITYQYEGLLPGPDYYGYFAKIYTESGVALGETIRLSPAYYRQNIQVRALADGGFSASWHDLTPSQSLYLQDPEAYLAKYYQYRYYDSEGTALTNIDISMPASGSGLPKASEPHLIPRLGRYDIKFQLPSTMYLSADYDKGLKAASLSSLFQGLLKAKGDLASKGEEGVLDPALIAKLVEEALRNSTLAVPVGKLTPEQMQIATMLANILNNPTAEQKVMIDAVTALLNEAQKLEEETGSEELKQASDDFTQMVATVLLAQALPDLLKEGDIANIKGIFGELDKEKSHILLEYQASVKAYYTNIVKELAANITTLRIKDLLSKNLTEKELAKLPSNQIDEIVKRIRNAKDKTYTEESILKQEAKYREEYLIPAKRILEENMKTLLQGFTQKLFGVLDGAGLVKGKVEQGKPVLNIDLSAK